AEDDPVAGSIDAPARNRIERRRPHWFAGAQAETGVVPWTADRVVDDEAVGERSLVVSAMRADGEDLVARFDDEHFLFADSSADEASRTKFSDRNTLSEVSRILWLVHKSPRCNSARSVSSLLISPPRRAPATR